MKKWLSKVMSTLKRMNKAAQTLDKDTFIGVDIAIGPDYTGYYLANKECQNICKVNKDSLEEVKLRKLYYLLRTVKRIRVKKKLRNRITKIENKGEV